MVKVLALIGSGALIAGTGLYFWVKKRKFDRTNTAGVEQFASFSGKLGATFVDKFLAGLSAFCIFAGAIFMAFGFEDSWGWIVLLPIYFVLLIGIW